MLIVSDCSPFEAREIDNEVSDEISSNAGWTRFDAENRHDGQGW